MGPLLFYLVLHPILIFLKSSFKIGFMDSISIFQFYFLQQKNIYLQAISQQKHSKQAKLYAKYYLYQIGEKRKSQKVGDLYDDLALVLQLKHSK